MLAQVIYTEVVCDAVQPGSQLGLFGLPLLCIGPQPEKHLLGDIFRILLVSQKSIRVVTDRFEMLFD